MWTRMLLVILIASACSSAQPAPVDPNSEPLNRTQPTVYAIKGDEFKIADRQRGQTESPIIRAITTRPLSRTALRQVARHLAGKAKHPELEVLSTQEALEACGRVRFAMIRGGADQKDQDECARGLLLWTTETESRVLHWGPAAPAEAVDVNGRQT